MASGRSISTGTSSSSQRTSIPARAARSAQLRASSERFTGASGSEASLLMKSMNWSMMALICATSPIIAARVAGSTRGSSISTSRRRRASGVRRSCETPARNVARSRWLFCRPSFISLKALATARTSAGPVSSRGGGSPPLPRFTAARASSASGRVSFHTMKNVARIAMKSPATLHAMSAVAGSRSIRPRGNATQKSRSPAGRRTHSTSGRVSPLAFRSPPRT